MTLPAAEALASGTTAAITASSTAAAPARVELGWGATLGDLGAFDQSMQRAVHRIEGRPIAEISPAAQALMRPFDHVNGQAASLVEDAQAAKESGRELSPSELLSMTAKCHVFMFHCQLTSNVANRTSDGLQQLFRQQS